MKLPIIAFFIGIMTVVIVGLFWFGLNDKESLNDFKKYAEFLTNKHEYEKAIYYYDKILLSEPQSLQVLLNKANALLSLREFEHATEIFDRVLELDPDNDSAINGKMLTKKMLTNSIEHVSTFNKQEIIDKPILQYHLESEYSVKINKDPDLTLNASLIYEKTSMTNSVMTDEIMNAGKLYDEQKYPEALSAYNDVLFNDPSNLYALNGKAESLLSLKQFDESIDTFENILSIYPDNINALNGKAYVYYLKAYTMTLPGMFYDSVHGYEKTLDIDPKNLNALVGIGYALVSLERYDEAVDYYMEALSVDADHKNAKNGLFAIWIKLGNDEARYFYFDSAIGYFDKVLAIDPKNLDALLAKASSYAEWGKSKEKHYTASENTYASILEYYPNNIQALTGMGYVLSEQLEFEKALFYYKRALEIDPENINAQTGKVFVLKHMN